MSNLRTINKSARWETPHYVRRATPPESQATSPTGQQNTQSSSSSHNTTATASSTLPTSKHRGHHRRPRLLSPPSNCRLLSLFGAFETSPKHDRITSFFVPHPLRSHTPQPPFSLSLSSTPSQPPSSSSSKRRGVSETLAAVIFLLCHTFETTTNTTIEPPTPSPSADEQDRHHCEFNSSLPLKLDPSVPRPSLPQAKICHRSASFLEFSLPHSALPALLLFDAPAPSTTVYPSILPPPAPIITGGILLSSITGWLAKAPAKAPTSITIGSTPGNPSQPLNDAYSDTECQNNAGKSAARSPIFELLLMFFEEIQEEFQLFHRHNFRGLSALILSSLYTSLCTEDYASL
ncbi:hypothetical protein PIB30_078965 [Stylosanthes scabra]|uniref:Uncharacterized protein n=1 Tax=Stylosanthes scabra TaxID=79078 RepID=A0ABU6RQZ7_9FABA|nr:hypothetical protein [Stylosanthes scabra]